MIRLATKNDLLSITQLVKEAKQIGRIQQQPMG